MDNDSFAQPGDIIEAWSQQSDCESRVVVLRTKRMEVMRLHLRSNTTIPTYEAQGEITILCHQGHAFVAAAGQQYELRSGQLLYLLSNEPFELKSEDESSLLITIVRNRGATLG